MLVQKMPKKYIVSAAISLIPLSLSMSQTASAFAPRVTQVPSNPWGCELCHVSPYGGGQRTSFGQDVFEFARSGSNIDWENVCALDSDDDGATNGAELGDPDCTWRRGDPQVTFDSTKPYDAAEFPQVEMPMAGEEMTMAGEEMTMAGEEVTMAGEEITMAGEEMTMAGEEMTMAGEEVTMAGEEVTMAGEEVTMAGEEVVAGEEMAMAGEEVMAGEEMMDEASEEDSGGCQASNKRGGQRGAGLLFGLVAMLLWRRRDAA